MDNPRPEKVAVVDEVKGRLSDSEAALLTEYRGLNVAEISALRRSLRQAGGDYKIYKNTLVRFAARDLDLEIEDLLTGPTAIAFVEGDPVSVAKALRDFARTNPNLVVKGGVLGDKLLSADETRALADVAPREELLARLAGAMAAPMQQFAGLLQAVPRSFAYGLSALIEQKGGAPEQPAPAPAAEPETSAAAEPVAEPAPTDTAEAAPSEDAATADDTTASAVDDTPTEAAAEATTEADPEPAADADTPTEDN
ncbi:MAG TPA: 50S ribosomal protein L10 [Acidimicrobiales bacterium]|nr:50S ribosomal protein L10 [Acidimicrobiales bacterium]